MKQLALLLFIAMLAGCASTGNKDDTVNPNASKPEAVRPETGKPSAVKVKPAKLPAAGVPKVKEVEEIKETTQPQSDDGDSEPRTTQSEPADAPVLQWQPIAIVSATYPQNALDKGIEGYVILEYTVTKTGSLKDIKVIDSSPHGYFEQAAINAAYKFRYNPRIVNGEPVDVPRAQYKMIFRLEYILPK